MKDDDAPVGVANATGKGSVVLVCDHASHRIPERLGALGLAPDALISHIAWDPGALGVARAISRRLDAPLVFAAFSRLVVDLNRAADSPTLMPAVSAGIAVPGNATITAAERAERLTRIYRPYHEAVRSLVATAADGRSKRGEAPPAVVAVHTFTPNYPGQKRPWHVGILFGEDRRLGTALLAELRRERDLVVGENEPYSPKDGVYWTLAEHAGSRGLLNVMIEIRNDQVAGDAAQDAWGERLAAALLRAIARSEPGSIAPPTAPHPATPHPATNDEGGHRHAGRVHAR